MGEPKDAQHGVEHGRWRDVARASGLLADDGHVRATIFAEMSALAESTGSVNLRNLTASTLTHLCRW